MKRFHILVCSFAVMAMVSSSELQAQGGGMLRMMMGGGGVQLDSSILAMEEVQKELELTDEQTEKIGAAAKEINDSLRSEMRDIFTGGGGDRSEMEAEMKDLMAELKEEEQEIIALLTDDQKDRLTQLRYQRMGTAMYQDEEVQKALDISDDQKESIDDAFASNEIEMQDAMDEARDSGDFGSIRTVMQDMQKKLTESLNGILTDDQKEKVTEMKGKEFKFPQRQRRRGGRSDF